MNNKYGLITFVAIAVTLNSPNTHAMTAMKSLFSKDASQQVVPAGNLSTEQLLGSFVDAQLKVLQAQDKLAQAYGLHEQSSLLQVQIDALSSTALDSNKDAPSNDKSKKSKVDVDQLKKSVEVSEATQTQINKYIEEDRKIAPESKKLYSEGVAAYGTATISGLNFISSSLNYATDTSMSGLISKFTGAKTAAFVMKSSPGYFKSFFDSTKKVFAYAKKNKIEVPKDATAQLEGM